MFNNTPDAELAVVPKKRGRPKKTKSTTAQRCS